MRVSIFISITIILKSWYTAFLLLCLFVNHVGISFYPTVNFNSYAMLKAQRERNMKNKMASSQEDF